MTPHKERSVGSLKSQLFSVLNGRDNELMWQNPGILCTRTKMNLMTFIETISLEMLVKNGSIGLIKVFA